MVTLSFSRLTCWNATNLARKVSKVRELTITDGAAVYFIEDNMTFKCTIPAVPTVQQDDAAVRITRYDFAPGAVTGWHRHEWPYFVIMLTDGVLRLHNGTEVQDVPLVAGQSYRRLQGIEHDVMNASPHPLAFVEIEIKRPEALLHEVV